MDGVIDADNSLLWVGSGEAGLGGFGAVAAHGDEQVAQGGLEREFQGGGFVLLLAGQLLQAAFEVEQGFLVGGAAGGQLPGPQPGSGGALWPCMGSLSVPLFEWVADFLHRTVAAAGMQLALSSSIIVVIIYVNSASQ